MTAHDRPRSLLDEATAIVATVGGVTLDRARAVLRAMSAHTHIKEQHVAALVVEWAVSGRLPAELRGELRAQLGGGHTAPGQARSAAP
ncbi:hypothetical protein [Streptomyces naganishii]|uniref:ANTAR domain-containing protein n=1 Tax=Streptomyces naganishii JCM 4654 TaxID=1306179 RepID=A0A919CUP7_9ACTN|nr:hypothetical protein [Streptomyces naganishii]GHD88190.1 hypothetical protein GCM10010508_23230 [Streptomyces naganishii JCM 4654]